MFLAKVVMFLKRSRLPGYQLLDVEELGGVHQSSSWNAGGYQFTVSLCEGKLWSCGGWPSSAMFVRKMTACLQERGGGDERAGGRESCPGHYIPGPGPPGAASLHRCASEKSLA